MRPDSANTTTTAAEAAKQLGGVLQDGFLSSSQVRIRGALTLAHLALDEIVLDGLSAMGPFVIAGCRIGSLRMANVLVRGGLIIEDCEIGKLDIRSASRTEISVVRASLRRCVLHRCGRVSIQASNVTEEAAISDAQRILDLGQTTLGSLRVTVDGPVELSEWAMRAVSVRDQLEASDLLLPTLRFQDVVAPRIQFRGVRADRLHLLGLSVEKMLDVQGLRPHEADEASVRISGVVGSVSLMTARDATSSISLEEATIRGDLTAGGDTRLSVCQGSSVNGVLRFAATDVNPRVELEKGASVRAIEAPTTSVRSPKRAREVANEILGGAGPTELAILHSSLSARTDEQDMAYFALRQAEVSESSGVRKAGLWLRGQLFGWGVKFGPPSRVLVLGVLATVGVLFLKNPTEQSAMNVRMFEATTGALSLWFNVGSATPEELSGPGWGLVAVVCTALGLGLITVVIGVAIRRLTR